MSQTNNTLDAFDAWASHWSGHYAQDGAMAERVERFASVLQSHVALGESVLDFGCGTGEIAKGLADRGWAVTGCDGSEEMLERARQWDGVNWRHFKAAENAALPFDDNTFQGVIVSSVLEYMDDLDGTLKEFTRILRPEGWLLTTVPDPRHPVRLGERKKRWLAHNDLLYPLLALTPWRHEFRYLRLSINWFDIEQWREKLQGAGLEPAPAPGPDHPLALLLAQKPLGGET